MKPPCKYPKKPTGPSGFGASGVRDLQRNGPKYQRTRPNTDLLSIQSGNFSKVIIDDEPEYLTTGFDGQIIRRDTKRYQQAFQKSRVKEVRSPVSLGGGKYAEASSGMTDGPADIFEVEYEYETAAGVFADAEFTWFVYNHQVRYGGYYSRGFVFSNYESFYSIMLPASGQYFFKNVDPIANYGVREDAGRSAVGLATLYVGRNDASARPLFDFALYRMNRRADNNDFLIDVQDFTRDFAEFWPIAQVIVLKDFTVAFFAEIFFRPGAYDDEEDYRPKFWMAATANGETFGTLVYTDLTPTVFAGARVPDPSGTAPNEYFTVTAGRQYGADLSFTLLTANRSVAVTGNNEFVMAWQQRMPAGWRQRVAHFSVAGGTVTPTMSFEGSDDPDRTNVGLWQSVVHVGEGVVLAKLIAGTLGINHAVTFRRSNDRGMTWGTPFTPIGFDAPLQNQYFGNLITDRALVDGGGSVVLITSWNPATEAYYVYESKDVGVTWTRRGKIFRPSEFLRIDNVIAGDGGGNFETLVPGPDRTRLPDVTLPDRYKDRV